MSLLVVVIALLLNQANISPCTHAQKLDSHDVPIHPLGRLQPKDILTGSDVLPINPLERTQPENIDDCDEELQKPTTRDLNERRLRRRLGGTIDERLLSVTEPAHLTNGPIVERVSLRSVTTAEKDFLRHVIRNETIPKLGKVSVSMERFLMKWLIHKSDCPVERTWKDLGFCYWPRWLSMGRCVNKQCSWPHGMSCVPSDPVPVYLLRWHCRKNRDGRKAKRSGVQASNISCRWLKFTYPIINQCQCKCKEKPDVAQKLLPVPLGN